MKIERKLSNKKMTEGKTRNVILVIAIALTVYGVNDDIQ